MSRYSPLSLQSDIMIIDNDSLNLCCALFATDICLTVPSRQETPSCHLVRPATDTGVRALPNSLGLAVALYARYSIPDLGVTSLHVSRPTDAFWNNLKQSQIQM